jgi:2-methylcitrate dehydratase PrpD
MSVLSEIISYVGGMRYGGLPNPTIEITKKVVLDILSTSIAGSSAEGINLLATIVKEWGGKEEATIAVYKKKVPAPLAALVNSSMARARDLDDVHERAGLHVDAAIVPAAFVLSEYSKIAKGKKVNGKEFILGNVVGSDLICRFRLAGGRRAQTGWSGDIFAPLAIALMGGKLLNFEDEKMLNALGIAYAQSAGNMQAHVEGSLTVRLQQGFGAHAGVLSVILADRGITGAHEVLEGKYGFYPLYMGGEFIPEEMIGDLGKRFEGANVSLKPYPCCKMTHGSIYGISELSRTHDIKPADVERISIWTNSTGYNLCGLGERKVVPQNVADAQFSYYYTAAVALIKGKVSLDDFMDDAIRNPQVLALAERVKVSIDPEKDKLQKMIPPIDIEIETKRGKRYKERINHIKGHPENAMSLEEVKEKFKDCSRFSAKPLNSENIVRICKMIDDLEELDDVSKIMEQI